MEIDLDMRSKANFKRKKIIMIDELKIFERRNTYIYRNKNECKIFLLDDSYDYEVGGNNF